MRRRMLGRLSGSMYLLWLALYIAGPSLWHHCPQHSAQPVAALSTSDHGAEHGAAIGSSATTNSHAHHGQAGQDGESSDQGCCCPGPACDTAAPAMVSRGLRFAFIAVETAYVAAGSTLNVVSSDERLLPFAIPPPARLTS